MANFWLPLAILAPALAALLVGVSHLAGLVQGEAWEKTTSRIVLAGTAVSLLAALGV